MIKIRIKNADHEIDIRFPISESELFAKLGEIHAVEGRDAAQSALVTDVYWPEEFSMLKDRFANLDELNYLGKRMESFDTLEYDQFLIGISKLDSKDVKDLINLTFNLNHFTLCQDVSSYGKIGREYVLNTEGAVPAHDEDDPKYATIGKDLIDRGLAQITERGLLIYNPFDELEEVYDGHTFPEYYYNNSLLSLNAEYGGRTELLQLPDEALAIKKATASATVRMRRTSIIFSVGSVRMLWTTHGSPMMRKEWCCHDRVPLVPRWAIHRWDCDNPCAVLPADQPHQRIRSRASQAPLTTE